MDGDVDGPKWVQVTREGNFPGYLGGMKPFAFTRVHLDEMVANLKANPAYVAGATGAAGTAPVIPWDFNHASEADPTSGDLPVNGAPSQGWTMDMEVRTGTDGTAELWALTKFNDIARAYVRAGQYLWASVAVAFNAVDQESGQNIGTIVTSIALTNTPFIEGMSKLVASRQGVDAVEARRMFFEAARDASEAISMMREMFALPETSGAADVMAQVAIVQQWLESGTAPIGTNPEELVGNLRIILNLPTLTSQAEVLQAASTSIQALLAEQAASAGVPATPETPGGDGMVPAPPADMMAARQHKDKIDMDELITILAAAMGVRANQASIVEEAKQLAGLRDSLVLAFGCRDGNKVILEAAKDGVDAKSKLLSIFEALEVADPEAALGKIQSTLDAASKLTEAMPELKELREEKVERDDADAEADVDTAIAASKLPASMRNTLLLHRKSNPEQFATDYPKPAAATPGTPGAGAGAGAHQRLLTRVATGPAADATPAGTGAEIITLSNYPGRNVAAQAKAYLAGTVQNWDKLTNEDQTKRARAFRKQSNVFDVATA